MHRGQMGLGKKWTSTIEYIKLKKPLVVRIEKGVNSTNIFEPKLHLCGSGGTLQEALECFFDHLFLDYCDYDVAPGTQSIDDKLYGKKLHALFHKGACGSHKRLLDFHG